MPPIAAPSELILNLRSISRSTCKLLRLRDCSSLLPPATLPRFRCRAAAQFQVDRKCALPWFSTKRSQTMSRIKRDS